MSDYGTPEEIKRKINQGIYLTEAKDDSKNALWSVFHRIYRIEENDKCHLPYVSCVKCSSVLSYDSAKGGTSHLRRHADHCTSTQGNPSISNFFKTSGVPKAAKETITDKCVDFICRDIRPFTIVEGQGFIELAQALINVGVRYGQVKAEDVLPHRTTISNAVSKRAGQIKDNVVIPDVTRYVNKWGGGVTTDMWTECHTQTPYITVTVHYITDDWQLVARIIATAEFDSQLKHTGVNIRHEFEKILNTVEINSSRVICVTDRGANMLAAFKDTPHIPCADHMLNTVLSSVFDNKKTLENLPDVKALLTGGKELVRYFKKSGLMKLLSKSLKQEVPTRWNSIYTLLKSIQDSYSEIEHILDTRSERYRYNYLVILFYYFTLKYVMHSIANYFVKT